MQTREHHAIHGPHTGSTLGSQSGAEQSGALNYRSPAPSFMHNHVRDCIRASDVIGSTHLPDPSLASNWCELNWNMYAILLYYGNSACYPGFN